MSSDRGLRATRGAYGLATFMKEVIVCLLVRVRRHLTCSQRRGTLSELSLHNTRRHSPGRAAQPGNIQAILAFLSLGSGVR